MTTPKGFGVLAFLATALMSSAFLRIADGGGAGLANAVFLATRAEAQTVDGGPPGELSAILATLKERQAALDERDARLDARQAVIDRAEDELRAGLADLQTAETRLERLLKVAEEANQQDLDRLSAVYTNMKPAEAAALFDQMPPDFAAGFLGIMAPEDAAPIMAALPAEAAYAISVMLAGRHAALPR